VAEIQRDQIGRFLGLFVNFGIFCKISPHFRATYSKEKNLCNNFDKNVVWGDVLTNASGHPAETVSDRAIVYIEGGKPETNLMGATFAAVRSARYLPKF
jgi:hypothetical protein